MTKSESRQLYKAKRAALTASQIDQLSQQLADRFFSDDQIRAALGMPDAVLHTFLPIRRQREVDAWFIIRRVWAEWPQVRVLSSVTDPQTHTMTSFALTPDTALAENRWGIPEPTLPAESATDVPTVVLVPLLVFDQRGHRVGYGGGYYDRFLAQLPAQAIKVGLSLFSPVPCIEATEPTDIPLTVCLEPTYVTWWLSYGAL